MTRVSLTEDYDDRSVIAKLKKMDEKLDANAGIVSRAEESARASAEAAQETADRFAGSVGVVVSDAKDEIAEAKAEVTEAKTEVDRTVTTVAQAVTTANQASASAQASAQTVQTYEDRLQRTEVGIQTLDGETADLYARDAMNLKSNEPNQTAQGLRIGTHDLSKAVTTDEAQTITAAKTLDAGAVPQTMRRSDTEFNARTPSTQRGSTRKDLFTAVHKDVTDTEVAREYTGMGKDYTFYEMWGSFYDDNGAVHHPQLGIRTNKTDGASYAYATTPTDSAPSNALATKAYVESTDGATNNLVHRTSNETVNGIKTFTKAPSMGLHEAGSNNQDGWRKMLVSPSFGAGSEYVVAVFDVADNHGAFGTVKLVGRNNALAGFSVVTAGFNPSNLRATRDSNGEVVLWCYTYRSVAVMRLEIHSGTFSPTFVDSGTTGRFSEPTTADYAQVLTPTGA